MSRVDKIEQLKRAIEQKSTVDLSQLNQQEKDELKNMSLKGSLALKGKISNLQTRRLDDDQEILNKAAGVNSSVDNLKAETLRIKQEKEEKKAREEEEKKNYLKAKADLIKGKNIVDTVTDAYSGAHETVMNTANKVTDTASNFWDSIGRWATPGTIFLPVSILLIFFFVLLPVNGHTRMEWLWLAMIGHARIKGSSDRPSQTVESDVYEAVSSTRGTMREL